MKSVLLILPCYLLNIMLFYGIHFYFPDFSIINGVWGINQGAFYQYSYIYILIIQVLLYIYTVRLFNRKSYKSSLVVALLFYIIFIFSSTTFHALTNTRSESIYTFCNIFSAGFIWGPIFIISSPMTYIMLLTTIPVLYKAKKY